MFNRRSDCTAENGVDRNSDELNPSYYRDFSFQGCFTSLDRLCAGSSRVCTYLKLERKANQSGVLNLANFGNWLWIRWTRNWSLFRGNRAPGHLHRQRRIQNRHSALWKAADLRVALGFPGRKKHPRRALEFHA